MTVAAAAATNNVSSSANNNNNAPMVEMETLPQSVEEAGALLGAAILQCSLNNSNNPTTSPKTVAPPKGMHSSFGTVTPIQQDLYNKLYTLRSQLKSVQPQDLPLVASPSILAVLMKLLGVSSSMATSPATQHYTPSIVSTPIRNLWVECVVQCLVLGDGLTGKASNDVLKFMKTMMALASVNPKSSKAAGGTRIAALQVLGELYAQTKFAAKLAPWALDVLVLCHRGLKSSGSGEPTHRIAAVQTASSVVVACRQARSPSSEQSFVVRAALEDRAIVETVRLLRHAAADKFPEVRSAAAQLACLASPVLISNQKPTLSSQKADAISSPTASLEDVLMLSLKNMDDESAGVASKWSEALARCLCASVEYGQEQRNTASERNAAARNSTSEESPNNTNNSNDATAPMRFSSRKAVGVVTTCSSLSAAAQFLVDHFIKAGGELAASRGGGSFSMGGRAVRVGTSLALVHLLSLQQHNIGVGRDVSLTAAISTVINMVGPEVQKQLTKPTSSTIMESLDATSLSSTAEFSKSASSATSLFSSSRYKSHADAGLARVATNRVLRQGLSEMAPEPTQVSILHEFIKLLSLSGGGETTTATASMEEGGGSGASTPLLNPHQLQVILIEVSHLIMTLGQAAAASLVELIPTLQTCLAHAEHGVRYEAAIACAAVSTAFPSEGRRIFQNTINDIQLHHAELVTLACMGPSDQESSASLSPTRSKRRFRRSPETKKSMDKSLPHQYAIHGHALLISILLQDLPHLPGGLSTDLLSTGLSVAEILVSCQYSDVITKSNPGAACTCVRAGYGIISGVLSTGATAISPHIALIFGLWQKSTKAAAEGSQNFSTDHDLSCLDAALSSMVVFLKHCSELLMMVPDALSKTCLILEEALPLFFPTGRLGKTPLNPAAVSRLSSAKSSIMEAFAWLPPGSFPMVADSLFTFAARHIQSCTEEEVTCSILATLVNPQDVLLDAKTPCRAQQPGQVGGARHVQENLVVLTSEAAHHGERESVVHFEDKPAFSSDTASKTYLDSYVLGLFASDVDNGDDDPPTPLHKVGTWRQPISPSSCSKVRLVDAAIQAFAATFSMKDGKEQQRAMTMLESLVPPFLAQLARAVGVNTALVEPERRSKSKEESAAVANITAVLLACLQSLPIYEATHNVPIGLGPRWMNKAKDLLLTLLPSASNIVRRASAEGLALLATLGVSEDAHTLQSAVLHSLDEVMQGNQPDGKPRPIPLESVSAARAGSLLTLACIQRTAYNIKVKQNARRKRGGSIDGEETALDHTLPTIQMMTRLLPSIACNVQLRDAFVVKTYALHSFGLLISYSTPRLDAPSPLSAEVEHLLRKAVEAVETNFLASWTAASTDFDQGQEAEKLASEAAFLSVLLRLMTFLLPALDRLKGSDPGIALRFSRMATSIAESCSSHPNVLLEAMAFFERLSAFQHLLPPPSPKVIHTENAPFTCVPFLLDSIVPDRPQILAEMAPKGCHNSPLATRAAVLCVKLLSEANVILPESHDSQVPSHLLALLEVTCGSRCFSGAALYRPIAAPREAELASVEHDATETEIVAALDSILILESFAAAGNGSSRRLLHWVLLARSLLTGNVQTSDENDDELDNDPYTRANVIRNADNAARRDASIVLDFASPSRWQVKCQAARIGCVALQQIKMISQANGRSTKESPDFNLAMANEECLRNCRELRRASSNALPSSYVVLHLPDILAAACSSAVATLDHSELHLLQEGGMHLISSIVAATGDIPDPEQTDVSILEQYTSQIFSSIKHGISSEENDGETSHQLFMAGCEALLIVMEKGLVTDPLVLKRLVRPVLPSASEIPFCAYEVDLSKSQLRPGQDSVDNHVTVLLRRIGKLWTIAKLRYFADRGVLSESVAAPLLDELDKCKGEIAVHSAGLAIDGARLLRGNGMTLCGEPILHSSNADSSSEDDSNLPVSIESGLTYMNIVNLDDSTKFSMVHAWPACACNALTYLVEMLTTEGQDSDVVDKCSIWLEKVVPLIFSGVHDSLSALTVDVPEDARNLWSNGLLPVDIAVMCLHGIRVLVRNASKKNLEVPGKEELGSIVHEVAKNILFLILGLDNKASSTPPSAEKEDGNSAESPSGTKDDGDAAKQGEKKLISDEHVGELVSETCQLLEELAASHVMAVTEESELLRTVLVPLDALQKGKVSPDNDLSALIIASCLKAARQLVVRPEAEIDMVKAMLHLSLQVLSSSEPVHESVQEAASALLIDSMGHESTTTAEQRLITKDMAKNDNWDAWAIVCARLKDGSGMRYSGQSVCEAMEDMQNPKRNLAALSAVRRLVQGAPAGSELVGCVMNGVGAQALVLLQAYGTNASKDAVEHRTVACADAMKVVMVAFQHLTADEENSDEQKMSAFMTVVFEVLVSLILFNGLPNHPSPTPSGADPALGRMAAQATMHVVRTTPVLFKTCMASLSDQGRAILELAVRAEMSGYAAPQVQAPTKKKLSLKGFKK